MPEKKKPQTAGEAYDEGARALMKAIDARRSERAAGAPFKRLVQRVEEREGRPFNSDVDMPPAEIRMFKGKTDPYNEYMASIDDVLDATRPWREAVRNRSSFGERLSEQSGTPGELLPPYREEMARRIADPSRYENYPKYAATWTGEKIEDAALRSRGKTPPVTQADVDAMREMFKQPGETSDQRRATDALADDLLLDKPYDEVPWGMRFTDTWHRLRAEREGRPPKKKGK